MARWTSVMLLAALVTGPIARASARPDVAVWVYGAHQWAPGDVETKLSHLPGGARHLFLSVEEGPRLILDDPVNARRIADLLDRAGDKLGLTVDAMLLQDPAWASDPDGAVDRVGHVLAFQRARVSAGRPGFSGLHFDIEPFAEDAWPCADVGERRRIVRNLQAVFARIALVVRQGRPPLRLTAALPWWLGVFATDVPEIAPDHWLGALDEAVLMVYGEPGGPLVGESAAAILTRLGSDRLWMGLPQGRGLRIGLATYEYRDEAAIVASMRQLESNLAGRQGFDGFAVFADGQPFDVPLAAALAGRVVDGAGQPVVGAVIRVDAQATRSTSCGGFGLRGLPAPTVHLTIEATGFAPASLTVGALVPGRLRELSPVILRRVRE
jgi:hypothetical protein